jgi:Stigma-specific protein, Stig1
MGGALLGAALASIPGVAWADGCRRLGRACRRDSQCCSRRCIGRGNDKVCGCPTGQTLCKKPRGEGRCVNLQTNERHCGSCFNRCEDGQECVEGMCSGGEPICDPPCPDGCTCSTDIAGAGPTCIDVDVVPVSSCTECPPQAFPNIRSATKRPEPQCVQGPAHLHAYRMATPAWPTISAVAELARAEPVAPCRAAPPTMTAVAITSAMRAIASLQDQKAYRAPVQTAPESTSAGKYPASWP